MTQINRHIFAEQTVLILETHDTLFHTDEYSNGKPDMESVEWYSISLALAEDLVINPEAKVLKSFLGSWLAVPDTQPSVDGYVEGLLKGYVRAI